jgi:RNA-dependent RNA polymerase
MLGSATLMFFHEHETHTVKDLLKGFGDLDSVFRKSGYGKYAARLGMSFSSTVAAGKVDH